MAQGESYTQSTALANSYVKVMKLILKSKAKLLNKLKQKGGVTQKNHTWTYDSVATPASVSAAVEGAAITPDAPGDLSEGTNYCQIVKKSYSISGTQDATMYQGVDSYLALQKKKALEFVGINIEWAILNGTGNSGATGTGREMKGIRAFASANTDCDATATSTTVSGTAGEVAVNSMLTLMWAQGADADLIICSSANKANLDAWSAYNTRFQDTKDGKIMSTVNVYGARTGVQIELMMHALANDTDIYGVVTDDLYVAYMRPTNTRDLPRSMDGIPFLALAEATLECRGVYSCGYVIIS